MRDIYICVHFTGRRATQRSGRMTKGYEREIGTSRKSDRHIDSQIERGGGQDQSYLPLIPPPTKCLSQTPPHTICYDPPPASQVLPHASMKSLLVSPQRWCPRLCVLDVEFGLRLHVVHVANCRHIRRLVGCVWRPGRLRRGSIAHRAIVRAVRLGQLAPLVYFLSALR